MLLDAGTPERAAFARVFDVCVVGTGPGRDHARAGARRRGLDVALMEAGELDFSEESQAFYAGDVRRLSSCPTDEVPAALLRRHHGALGGQVPHARPHDFAPAPGCR